jgi:hypothetical protein
MSQVEPWPRPAELDSGRWYVPPTGSLAVLGLDDWAFGQVEAELGTVCGRVVVPYWFGHRPLAGDPFSAELQIDLWPLTTGHPRLDRRLRSLSMLDLDRHGWMRLRATHPRPAAGRWALNGILTLASVTDAVPVRASFAASLAADGVRVSIDFLVDRQFVGMTGYRYRIGPQFRVHIDAAVRRSG